MKRLLLLLLLAVPARADVIVVRYPTQGSPLSTSQSMATLIDILDGYGVTWNVTAARNITAANIKNGIVPEGTHNTTYDCVIHWGCNANTSTAWCGITTGTWATVPQIFIADPTAGSAMWTETAACSTGVSGYATSFDVIHRYRSQYMAGALPIWKELLGSDLYSVTRHATAPPGILRMVVGSGASSATRRFSGAATGPNVRCTDCDSMPARQADPDSVLLWARYRVGNPLAPLIFVASGTVGPQSSTLLKMALTMADSASGGLVFENRDKLAHKRAIVIRRALGTGRYDNMTGANGGGLFCAADSCDSVNVKAGRDSVIALGIPITVALEPDSMSARANQLGWWSPYPQVRFCLESYSGSATTETGTAASSSRVMDPFGHVRTRAIYGDGSGIGSDTSMVAQVQLGFSKIRAVVGDGRVSATVLPAFFDYTPAAITRTGSALLDSLNWAFSKAGVKAVIVSTHLPKGNVNRSFGQNIGASAGGTDPWGFYSNSRIESVPTSIGATTNAGRIKYLAAHAETPALNWDIRSGGHDVTSEWLSGILDGVWYAGRPTLSPHYDHDFFTTTPILCVVLQQLGGAGQGTTPTRMGWWTIKWLNNQMKACDALKIPGKPPLDVWAYPEECVP